MVRLLKYDASERITAREALRHAYFKDVREQDARDAEAAKAGGTGAATAAASGSSSYHQQQKLLRSGELESKDGKNLPSITGGAEKSTFDADTKYQPAPKVVPGYSGSYGTQPSSLPPIGSMGAGATGFSKFGQKQPTAQQQQQSNAQKRRKKSKLQYGQPSHVSQQHKQRQANSENVMRAYGVPKLDSKYAPAGGADSGSGKVSYPPVRACLHVHVCMSLFLSLFMSSFMSLCQYVLILANSSPPLLQNRHYLPKK
ncbi:hypothetical protein B484DRAFT_459482 [Ochromonadaceae sp. CCMP2298]|nr:hypothetical protein B484DRAFT_459482 [Ochromonadaceae sp. CCMP2298]